MRQEIAAILLCLGEASRMRPLSLGISKVFLPFCNRPVIEYTLSQLASHGVRTIILVTGTGDDFAERYVAWGSKRNLRICILKRGLECGSGGVVRDVIRDSVLLCEYSDFLIIYADSILAINFRKMFENYRVATKRGCSLMVACHTPEDLVPLVGCRSNYGVLQVDPEQRVVRFQEKPTAEEIGPSDVASTGVFLLSRCALTGFPTRNSLDLSRDVLAPLAKCSPSPLFAFDIGEGFRYDVGTISEFVERQFALLLGEFRVPGVRLHGLRRSGPIRGGGRVRGTAIVGRHCRFGRGTILKDVNVIGHQVHVGKDSTLENSIIFDHVQIGDNACVSGCVLGSRCVIRDAVRLNPGTVVGNHSTVH